MEIIIHISGQLPLIPQKKKKPEDQETCTNIESLKRRGGRKVLYS